LLEGGGYEPSEISQSVYRGVNVGHDYLELDSCRLRYLGGTSNHWTGWCRPLDAEDFTSRRQIPDSGWPISKTDLQVFLSEACEILEVGAFPQDRPLRNSGGRLREIARHRSAAPVRFGQKYRELLRQSDAIHTVLNANVVDIQLGADHRYVTHFVVAGADPGEPRYVVTADHYVLAMGGLENARIMLNVDGQQASGIGNNSGLVGRYFMDHPHLDIGYYVLGSSPDGFGAGERYLALTHVGMGEAGVAGAYLQVKPIPDQTQSSAWGNTKDTMERAVCASDIIADFVRATGIADCMSLTGAGILRVGSEQVPNSRSRVRLAAMTDQLGLRRLELDWQPLPIDLQTVRAGAMAVAEYFARQDIGRVKLFDWLLDPKLTLLPDRKIVSTLGASHHIGTTRMGFTDRDGVVDSDCRVFGVRNLYVAGSSVFRSSGIANPTLTIVQLALRLVDHLSRIAKRG